MSTILHLVYYASVLLRKYILYILVMNFAAFVVYGIDKSNARNGRLRISETTLILLTVLFGAPGAYLAMIIFHHKTNKPKFRYGVPILAGVQILFLAYAFIIRVF